MRRKRIVWKLADPASRLKPPSLWWTATGVLVTGADVADRLRCPGAFGVVVRANALDTPLQLREEGAA